jgi:glucose-1-phosphate adenylyltransferase
MMGADYYQTAEEVQADKAQGRPPIGVGRNGRFRRSIIDKNARIGDGVTLSPEGKPDGDYAHEVVIRDGILCVCKGAVIPSGFTL